MVRGGRPHTHLGRDEESVQERRLAGLLVTYHEHKRLALGVCCGAHSRVSDAELPQVVTEARRIEGHAASQSEAVNVMAAKVAG